ncbi:MAG: hypothetical protein EOO87_21705, partial [Pedobacter sp.]
MKLRLLILALFFSFSTFAQNKLSKSKQIGAVTFAYKITDKEVVSVIKDKKVNNDFYHTLVSSDYYKEYKKADLPYGNYLLVSAS